MKIKKLTSFGNIFFISLRIPKIILKIVNQFKTQSEIIDKRRNHKKTYIFCITFIRNKKKRWNGK